MNTPVSFEIAKLLKEKGYSQQGFPYYSKDLDFDDIELNHHYRDFYPENGYETFTAPTIAEVVMWLYEKQRVWIIVFEISKGHDIGFIWSFSNDYNNVECELCNSPTEAYSQAIEYTLKNLI